MSYSEGLLNVFAPLGQRLGFFETEGFLLPNNEHDVDVNQHDFFYFSMIDGLVRRVNSFDSSQVYKLADEYLTRIIRVQKLLKEHRSKNKKIHVAKWEMWESEIYDYLYYLFAILDAREEAYIKNVRDGKELIIEKKIQLPEKFSIKEMQMHFKPIYNHREIASLMFYMSKASILPPYEGGEYAKIASVFGFHDKTIAKDIRELDTKSKSELINVKKVAEALLQVISDDLTKASKP